MNLCVGKGGIERFYECEHDVCVLGLGRRTWWWKFHHWTRAKHIHHPGNGRRAKCSAYGVLPFLPKGKTLYAMRVRLHPGAVLQKWSRKWFVCISFSLFLNSEDEWPAAGKLSFYACCLRMNFPSLGNVWLQGSTFTCVCVCLKLSKKVLIYFIWVPWVFTITTMNFERHKLLKPNAVCCVISQCKVSSCYASVCAPGLNNFK